MSPFHWDLSHPCPGTRKPALYQLTLRDRRLYQRESGELTTPVIDQSHIRSIQQPSQNVYSAAGNGHGRRRSEFLVAPKTACFSPPASFSHFCAKAYPGREFLLYLSDRPQTNDEPTRKRDTSPNSMAPWPPRRDSASPMGA